MDTGGCVYSQISLNKIYKNKIRKIPSILEDIDYIYCLAPKLNSSFFIYYFIIRDKLFFRFKLYHHKISHLKHALFRFYCVQGSFIILICLYFNIFYFRY